MPKPRKSKLGDASASVEMNITEYGESQLSTLIRNSARFLAVEPVRNDEEIAERLDKFFEDCVRLQDLPTVEKMALALGVQRMTVWNWANKPQYRGTPRFYMAQKALQILHAIESDLALRGFIPPVVYIFRGKNYFGMVDTPVLPESDGIDTFRDTDDVAAIIEKYTQDLPTQLKNASSDD